ncbi:MAG: stage V sporulation T C-terminal domain-containing protein [Dehalococcoidales bacterium]|nr:stage V sporulation T C-terminal domain-containing protein [Dehalococcoidales bacterium]
MKATGIVWRIDDLGRVVIPKEIRRSMRIREGDPLEIYTDKDGSVIFKKYSVMGDMSETATNIVKTLNLVLNQPVVVVDRDTVIAAAGKDSRSIMTSYISREAAELMEYRCEKPSYMFPVCENMEMPRGICFFPIMAEGDVVGAIIVLDNDLGMNDTQIEIVRTMAKYLGREMES